ncbi:MAG: PDDEXK nuclease domain-containing protein [Chitinophagales bacterium]|jgi:predicted nuclease of restriction endonuclease-like (RecB) superfamily|nr:PDDEXK nuclease domain-containing protein [Chitinophagales bacterium]
MGLDNNYIEWITTLKDKIRSAQIKASLSVNEQLIMLYWEIGKSIVEKQQEHNWGSKIIENMAKDLKRELPETNGFSRTNLFAMRKFYLFYAASKLVEQPSGLIQHTDIENNTIVQQPAGQLEINSVLCKIPWWHHQIILSNCNTINEAQFYIYQTIENNWSRNVLQIQIESNLFDRQGKALNNFKLTLPKPQSDLAIETLKDPYKFDFLTLEANVQELELEKSLTENITQFLLELGKGFAFVGRQYPLQIGTKERKLDLLFYHLKMHCYVVIDLKMGEFEPEYAGKMNYYLSAVDDLLKTDMDQPSIGIILCKTKENIDVEYALRDISKPLGISEFSFNELPATIQSNFPTVEEIENQLTKKLL